MYKPDTPNLKFRVIPLDRNADTVHQFNKIIGLRLNVDNVVEYIKFFGIVIHQKTFYFFDNVEEIPWSQETNETAKENLVQRLREAWSLYETGDLDIKVKEEFVNRELLPDFYIYSTELPCIYENQCFKTVMRITPYGQVEMKDDTGWNVPGLTNIDTPLPFYRIEPTKALADHLGWRNRFLNFSSVIGIVTFFVVLATMLSGLIANFFVLVDVILDLTKPSWSFSFNDWLRSHYWILVAGLAGAITSLFFAAIIYFFQNRILLLTSRLRSVNTFDAFDKFKKIIRSQPKTFGRRLMGLAATTVRQFIALFLLWAVILFTTQSLFSTLFSSGKPPLLNDSIYFILSVFWSKIPDEIIFPIAIRLPFSADTTWFGDMVVVFLYISLTTLIIRSARQYWKMTALK